MLDILYTATGNAGKLREFSLSANREGLKVLPLPGLAGLPEPVEDAPDFMGNAVLKAVAYSRFAPGLAVMADDSGLEVDALGGRPGVRSARFAEDFEFEWRFEAGSELGPLLTKDERNNRCLLTLLRKVQRATEVQRAKEGRAGRRARFVCALAVARDGAVLHQAEGVVEGEVLEAPRGTNGFGYDPLFLLPSLGRTLAELDPAEKWANSHRGHAFRSLLGRLAEES